MIAPVKLVSAAAITAGSGLIVATYTPEDWGKLIAAAGLFVGILFNGYTSIIAARRASAAEAAAAAAKSAAEAVRADVGVVSATANKIESHTNGAVTKADAIIAAQETQLAMLRDVIADKDRTAAALAQAKATTEALAATAPSSAGASLAEEHAEHTTPRGKPARKAARGKR